MPALAPQPAFQILQSEKSGLHTPESYIIVRGRTSFLRILGREPHWELMTATASEDHGRIGVCPEQRRLIEAALRMGAELGTAPSVEQDRAGREYVKICSITQHPGQDDPSFNENLRAAFERFFQIYDDCGVAVRREREQMRALYDALAPDDRGEDVYLSDGLWLDSDGAMHDRGR